MSCVQKVSTSATKYFRVHARYHPLTALYSQNYRCLSTKKPVRITSTTSNNNSTLWKQLKAPAIFGIGLYLGLMIFGEHQETKQGSAYLIGLSNLFWSGCGGHKKVEDEQRGNGDDNNDTGAGANKT